MIPSEDRFSRNHLIGALVGGVGIGGVLVVVALALMPSAGYSYEQKSTYGLYADTNQTRGELFEVIENQRDGVYGSYPLEFAFCKDRLGDDVLDSNRSNLVVKGTTISELIQCKAANGQTMTYAIEFDLVTKEYKESIRLRLANS